MYYSYSSAVNTAAAAAHAVTSRSCAIASESRLPAFIHFWANRFRIRPGRCVTFIVVDLVALCDFLRQTRRMFVSSQVLPHLYHPALLIGGIPCVYCSFPQQAMNFSPLALGVAAASATEADRCVLACLW